MSLSGYCEVYIVQTDLLMICTVYQVLVAPTQERVGAMQNVQIYIFSSFLCGFKRNPSEESLQAMEEPTNFISTSKNTPTEMYLIKKGVNGTYDIANLAKEQSFKWTSKGKMGLSCQRGQMCLVYPDRFHNIYKFVAQRDKREIFGELHHKSTLVKHRFYGNFTSLDGTSMNIYMKIVAKVVYIYNNKPEDGGILLAKGQSKFNGKHGLFNNRKYYVLLVAANVDAEFMTCLWLTARESIETHKWTSPSGTIPNEDHRNKYSYY